MRREILIDSAPGEVRVALVEDDLLAEVFIERSDARGVAGNIYKGRVSNVLPGMQSAFIDLGLERDAFLYVEDIAPSPPATDGPSGDDSGDACESLPDPPPRPCIEDFVAQGEEIVVQVTKDPLAQKGARATAHVSLPGRYLVYLPGVSHVGVSRRIEDPAERERLKSMVGALVREHGLPGGFIVRTAGEGRARDDFSGDARYLGDLWSGIQRRAEWGPAPVLLHQEVGAVARVLRDVFHPDVAQVRIESEELFREAVEFMERVHPELAARVRRHDAQGGLFEECGIPQQLERALRPRVWLKSGGHIVINQTEALVAIDVNTGKYTGRRRLEETVLRTNLEAVGEVVRQVRLRDLGGIVVIDFIDMEEASSRAEVARALQQELRKDRSKSRMLQISEFGLVEITRQRTRPSLERLLCVPCPGCGGSGRVKSPATLYFEILREVLRLRRVLASGAILVRVHPAALEALQERHGALAAALDLRREDLIILQGDAALRPDQWSVVPAAPPGPEPRPGERRE